MGIKIEIQGYLEIGDETRTRQERGENEMKTRRGRGQGEDEARTR